MQNTISEHTTHRTLKQMGSSSRRPHRVPLLSDKNRTRRIQFTQTHQNWTIEDWKTLPGLDLIHMLGSEFGVKNMKAWIILSCLNGSGSWWWCNGVEDIFLAHFGSLSTNWAAFKHHNLPEYCYWPCPSLYDYSVPIFWCYFQKDNVPCHKAQIISDWFLEHDNEFIDPFDPLLKWSPQSQSRDAIMSISTNISEECFQHLVESMPRWIKAVLKAKGGPTRY